MIIPVEAGERPGGDLTTRVCPEKGFLIVGAGRDTASRHEALGQPRARPDHDAVPHSGPVNRGAGLDPSAAEHASGSLEAGRRLSEEDTQPVIEVPAFLRERSSAIERFERRAEEIARAAEIGKRLLMEEEPDFLAPFVDERLPQVGHERSLPRGDAGQEPRRQNADSRVEERTWAVDAERCDAVPFGLKRRVLLRVPIFRDEQRGGAARPPMERRETGEIRSDRGVGVDEEEIAARQKGRRVAECPCSPEDLRLRKECELGKLRRLAAQVALDLVAQVMEINRYFADAGLAKPPEMCEREGNVQKG
jgi:hypothetical protein